MADVLLVSKPIAPPWHDSSKNLVRDLASRMQRHTPVVMARQGVPLALGRARSEAVYGHAPSAFSPALRDNARVLARLLLGQRLDLWHFFFAPNPRTSQIGRGAALVRRARTLQTVCSAPHADADLQRVLFADRVIVLSEHTRQRFLTGGIAPTRLRLIAPAVPELHVSETARRGLRTKLALPDSVPVVVYPGDLEFGRGADLALQAHADLPRSLGAHLIMACRAKTGRAREREADLIREAERLGVTSSVRFIGETTDIHALLALADLVSLPTDTLYAKMDLPLVALEAMALGRALLIGEGTPAQELARGGAAVTVATERAAVSALTLRLLDDAARRSELGARARDVARTEYTVARMAERYESVYDELCA